ncbi:hypothetical protein MANY_25110 [Mycolicibacterium anyangense]|uniref:DUF4190 domain-containing protein n=1 Tax=Mycolicibacterium anyangense TaxID=1431246 RepID=A0A6N4WAU9_9MYCO|nr:DUF4190 domain-containing protein [Mycolicibacterium anyangense]BBZ77174.1 hypothetical protein MANY_25110 [Mycolicibacterium anyangense]
MTNPPPPFEGAAPDPYAPVDYPANYPPLPPPVYPAPYPLAGYPYPPYPGDPYDPYRPLKPPGTNGKAIAALVCSLAGMVFCGLPSIAGVILGIVAMRETKRTGQDGFGLAVAGVAIGAAIVALALLYVLFMVFIVTSTSSYENL